MISQRKFINATFLLGFAAFVLIGIFGMSHLGMDINTDGHMSNCPFMLSASLCTMTPFEHIAAFKHLLNALPQHESASSLLKLFLSFAVLILFFRKYLLPLAPLLAYPSHPNRRYPLRPRHVLQEVFSDGILNSKRF